MLQTHYKHTCTGKSSFRPTLGELYALLVLLQKVSRAHATRATPQLHNVEGPLRHKKIKPGMRKNICQPGSFCTDAKAGPASSGFPGSLNPNRGRANSQP